MSDKIDLTDIVNKASSYAAEGNLPILETAIYELAEIPETEYIIDALRYQGKQSAYSAALTDVITHAKEGNVTDMLVALSELNEYRDVITGVSHEIIESILTLGYVIATDQNLIEARKLSCTSNPSNALPYLRQAQFYAEFANKDIRSDVQTIEQRLGLYNT